MIELLENIDNEMFLALHSLIRTPFLDHFMMLFSGKWIWVAFYVALAWMVMKNHRNAGGLLMIVATGLAIAITDQTCAALIRPLVGRLRPSNPGNPISAMVMVVDGYRGGSYGFPSCHAGNSMALAVLMLLAYRRRWFGVFMLCWALVNSLSRVYLGVHYPGDLLVGWTIGSIAGGSCYLGWRWISRRLGYGESGPMESGAVPAAVAGATVLVIIVVSAVACR